MVFYFCRRGGAKAGKQVSLCIVRDLRHSGLKKKRAAIFSVVSGPGSVAQPGWDQLHKAGKRPAYLCPPGRRYFTRLQIM